MLERGKVWAGQERGGVEEMSFILAVLNLKCLWIISSI